LADVFLEAGARPEDQNNKPVMACRKIEAEFVKEWGKNKAAASDKPMALERI
jgi:hypothetical protein